jgi:hypothetical protein
MARIHRMKCLQDGVKHAVVIVLMVETDHRRTAIGSIARDSMDSFNTCVAIT